MPRSPQLVIKMQALLLKRTAILFGNRIPLISVPIFQADKLHLQSPGLTP
jgi:hypothetical protein